jgi:hypothetical protein
MNQTGSIKALWQSFVCRKSETTIPSEAVKQTGQLPLSGHLTEQVKILELERWSDAALTELNSLLPWRAYVVDSKGRRFGNRASTKKRAIPQGVPDRRTSILNNLCPLGDKSVLEVGCFEGIHTVGLCRAAAKVVAIDSRVENVIKTIVRTNMFGCYPKVMLCDLENVPTEMNAELACDVVHHIGVLYHLSDPVGHLHFLNSITSESIFLDTHVAPQTAKPMTYESHGKTYRYHYFNESGYADAFSGMKDHSKWLFEEDLFGACRDAGFQYTEKIEHRDERNGPRILMYASKKPIAKN